MHHEMPVPERRTLDYNDLPPMMPVGSDGTPVEPQAAAPTKPVPPQQVAPASVEPEDDTDNLPDEDDVVQAEADGEDDDVLPDDVAELKRLLKEAQARLSEADEYESQIEAQHAEQQRLQAQRNAEAYWRDAQKQADQWYVYNQRKIRAEADNAINPLGYYEERMAIVNAQYNDWYKQFYAEQARAHEMMAIEAAIPQYALELADYYGLPRDAVQEIMAYPIDLMDREAMRIKADRDREKARKAAETKAARKKQREEFPMTHTGNGRSGGSDVPLGSDEHYNSIPWGTT